MTQFASPPIAPKVRPVRDQSTSAEERLKKTLFLVEATNFEQQALWCTWSKESGERPSYIKPVAWEQVNPGWSVQVGKIGKLPVCVSVTWARIDGHLVCFYDAISRAYDSELVDKWFKQHFKGRWDSGTRRAHCDASNFHFCMDAVRDANTPKADKFPEVDWVEEEIFFDRTRGLAEKGKKIVILDQSWGPVGADNPIMRYKYRIDDEDPIEKGPYYTELETPRLLELAAKIKPVYRPRDSDLYYLADHELTVKYLRGTAFLWSPKPGKKAEGLNAIDRFKSYHSYAYYGFFKPDIAETLAQIPAEYLDRVVAFELTEVDLNKDEKAFNAGYHTAQCVLYEYLP